MKKLLVLLSSLLVLNHASAALPFYEPFADATAGGGSSYAVGSYLTIQTNSGNPWQAINSASGTNQPLIFEGNLSYLNLPASTGNSVLVTPAISEGATGGRLNLNATVTSGRTYYSMVLKITNIDAVPTDAQNNWFSGFGDGVGAQTTPLLRIGAKVLTKRVGDGYVFGVGRSTTTTGYVYDESHVYSLNDTVFIVAAYEQLAGNSTNEYLWVNPAPSSFGAANPPSPNLSVSTVAAPAAGVLNTSGVKSLILACQNSTAPTAIIDEVRVGTNWPSVVPVSDPSITQNPVSKIVPPGGNVTFTVTAAGTPGLTYQWYKNLNLLSNGGNVSGATTDTLQVNNVSPSDVGSYTVVVTNGLGSTIRSIAATLSLSDPAITSQPQSRTNNYSTTATFTVAVSGTAPFTYQWQKEGIGNLSNGGNVSGSQSATLTLTGVSYLDAGNYFVSVSNPAGATNSTSAVLTVKDPAILVQPLSVTNVPGSNVSFHVVAAGTGTLSYQWRKGGNYIFDVGSYSGTATDTLNITGISAGDQGNYSVVVVGINNTVETSADAVLTVLSPVAITTPPVARTVAQGSKVSFGVVASGTAPLSYQWLLGGAIINGATASTYTVTNAQLSGNYSVIISNSVNAITSSPVALNVSTNIQLFETNLVVVRVGDISQTLNLTGNSIYLDQFTTDGTYVNTVTIPDDGSTGIVTMGMDNITGVNNGSTTGTSLTRSLDRRFMVIAGYKTNLNYSTNLYNSTSATVPRGIGLINSHAQYTLPVASTNSVFDQTYWRTAITDGTNNFWGAGGTSGTYYFGFDSSPVVVQNTFANNRSMGLFNGDIYCSTAAGATGILKINGMPTTAVTPTVLFNGSSGNYDMSVSPNGNLIYVADQRSLGAGGGILRYDFDGTIWALTYTLQIGGQGAGTHGPRYLTVDYSGANPVIYTTSNDGTLDNNRILKVVDTGADSVGTSIAIAGINQTFRGIHFGPVASPATVTSPILSIARSANNVVLSWSGAFNLQAAANVTGTYTNVSGATSPYTNSVNSSAQTFFRLSQ